MSTTVVDQSKKVEGWQTKLASWPLKKLSKVDRLEQLAMDVDEVQTITIKHGYDLMRAVINTVDDISEEIIAKTEKRIVAA